MFVIEATEQLSVAVGVPRLGEVEHVEVIAAGQEVITGAWVSFTVTAKILVLELPAASVAVAVTLVVPTLKNEPEAGLNVTVALQLSVTVWVPVSVTLAPH